jgi:GNAT superfamily N-acetyltransferase
MGLMVQRVLKPEEASYLEHLNECFPSWGDQSRFEWAFHRDCGAGVADLLLARFDGELIGGTGVNYRRVMHPSGRESTVGIMSGSWVLPAARGKGCFTRMIEAMTECTAQRRGSLLVAYAFASNPSYRAMQRAGLAVIDTSYLRDPGEYQPLEASTPIETLSVGDRSAAFVSDEINNNGDNNGDNNGANNGDRVRFLYAPAIWSAQFLHGPNRPAYLELPGESVALVEEADGFLRVQALVVKDRCFYPEVMQALFDTAARRHRRLFLFSVDAELTHAAEVAGCERMPGGYFMKIANREALAEWVGCAATERLAETDLMDPHHTAYLGKWQIQNRDRM